MDHAVKTTITTILAICVGCRIAIKTEKTHHLVDGFAIGLKKEIETQKLEDLTTLPLEHLETKDPMTDMIATATTRAILNHQSIFQPTRRTTISIA